MDSSEMRERKRELASWTIRKKRYANADNCFPQSARNERLALNNNGNGLDNRTHKQNLDTLYKNIHMDTTL